jgi:serine/threonine-protein kinase
VPASRLTDEIGRVVGGRYRLVAALGAGPSAQVFLADDVRLRRRVAVKLLPEALTEEHAFVERFRAEMQAAAGLRHPHILVVHDWGTSGGLYLVTEYLEGGSLRAMLDRGARLSPSQALQVGLAAARALEFAHSRGVVHRDVRPSNLLFTDDGRLRVGDFGLARAFADAAWTEPLGAGGAAARYASPEQAQGRSIDGRADVYSLALVLVEAVTGQLPFQADTALATLMARVGTPLAVPDELGPLAGPLTRAGTDDPEARLEAAGLVVALMAIAESLPPPAALPLSPPSPEVVDEVLHDDDTLVVSGDALESLRASGRAPSVGAGLEPSIEPSGVVASPPPLVVEPFATPIEASSSVGPSSVGSVPADGAVGGDHSTDTPPGEAPDDGPDVEPWIAAPRPAAEAAAASPSNRGVGPDTVGTPSSPRATATEPASGAVAVAGASIADEPDDAEVERRRRNRRRWTIAWVSLLVVALLGGGVVGALIWRANQTPTHPVPAISGKTAAVAEAQLRQLGFVPKIRYERRDGSMKGELLGVDPAVGTKVAEGRTVTLVVSRGQTLVTVPRNLAGLPEAKATAALAKLGLTPTDSQQAWSETVAAGDVVGLASGTPKQLEKGSAVTLVVSKGPQPRVIPDISGMSPDQATAALTQLGLVPHTVERYDQKVDKGGLIGLEPGPGTSVPRGADVNVVVSKGLLVAIPSLDGVHNVRQAIDKLESAGLVANSLTGTGRLSGKPVAFDPPEGQLVPKGSSVDIVVR